MNNTTKEDNRSEENLFESLSLVSDDAENQILKSQQQKSQPVNSKKKININNLSPDQLKYLSDRLNKGLLKKVKNFQSEIKSLRDKLPKVDKGVGKVTTVQNGTESQPCSHTKDSKPPLHVNTKKKAKSSISDIFRLLDSQSTLNGNISVKRRKSRGPLNLKPNPTCSKDIKIHVSGAQRQVNITIETGEKGVWFSLKLKKKKPALTSQKSQSSLRDKILGELLTAKKSLKNTMKSFSYNLIVSMSELIEKSLLENYEQFCGSSHFDKKFYSCDVYEEYSLTKLKYLNKQIKKVKNQASETTLKINKIKTELNEMKKEKMRLLELQKSRFSNTKFSKATEKSSKSIPPPTVDPVKELFEKSKSYNIKVNEIMDSFQFSNTTTTTKPKATAQPQKQNKNLPPGDSNGSMKLVLGIKKLKELKEIRDRVMTPNTAHNTPMTPTIGENQQFGKYIHQKTTGTGTGNPKKTFERKITNILDFFGKEDKNISPGTDFIPNLQPQISTSSQTTQKTTVNGNTISKTTQGGGGSGVKNNHKLHKVVSSPIIKKKTAFNILEELVKKQMEIENGVVQDIGDQQKKPKIKTNGEIIKDGEEGHHHHHHHHVHSTSQKVSKSMSLIKTNGEIVRQSPLHQNQHLHAPPPTVKSSLVGGTGNNTNSGELNNQIGSNSQQQQQQDATKKTFLEALLN